MRTSLAPLAALIFLALALPAAGEEAKPEIPAEDIQVGAGLVCDTAAQVARYVELFHGDADAAAKAVNEEFGTPDACMFGIVAYVRGADVGELKTSDNKVVQLTEILVFGVGIEGGLARIEPVRWYTLFPSGEVAI